MPDFDTRQPQESDEPNGLRGRSLTNRVRNSLIANRLRTLLIGGGITLFVGVGISVGLVMYSFGGPGALTQEPLGEAPNGKLAFAKGDQDIYVMNPDGTGERNLTNTSTVSEFVPAWSPDGERIAFEGGTTQGTFGDDIYVMNADGSGRTKLTDTSVSEEDLAWSPNGEKIAFQAQTKNNPDDIYVMNADGTARMRLSDTPRAGETNPTWSPDGEKIAFWVGEGSVYGAICMINADGTGRRCVADEVHLVGAGVAWGSG